MKYICSVGQKSLTYALAIYVHGIYRDEGSSETKVERVNSLLTAYDDKRLLPVNLKKQFNNVADAIEFNADEPKLSYNQVMKVCVRPFSLSLSFSFFLKT